MQITDEQIQRINVILNSLPIAYISQVQEIVKIFNESKEEVTDE
jgi:hypothetical protein